MSKPFDVRDQLANFAGTAPLFPLPDVVHFPHLLLPLHIFEPRYREMTADALAGDRLIAMALLKPGCQSTDGSPPIHDVVCLGRITANQQTDDGRYYLVLQGLSRARVVREEDDDLAYRTAQLELFPDPESSFSPAAAAAQRRRLLLAFRSLFPKHNLDRVLRRALKEAVPLGILCDVLADAMSLETQVAYRVLAETDVKERCRLILRLIEEKLRANSAGSDSAAGDAAKSTSPAAALGGDSTDRTYAKVGWPPQFSVN
jgi:Lon protease-like protein